MAMQRFNGTCKVCKTHHTVLANAKPSTFVNMPNDFTFGRLVMNAAYVHTDVEGFLRLGTGGFLMHECCLRPLRMEPVRGKLNPLIVCSAKCRSSKGHLCECSCGGKNHGAG